MRAFTSAALLREAALWVAGAVACAGLVLVAQGGASATTAVLGLLAGAALAGMSVVALAQGLALLLDAGVSPTSGSRWAAIGFFLRHVVVATATYFTLRAGVSPVWFLVGVTAWPMALAVAGFRALLPVGAERA